MSLGIDLGTTGVKATVLDAARRVAGTAAVEHGAAVECNIAGAAEQDPAALLRALRECLAALPGDALGAVTAVGVTGQMHGVVLWVAPGGPAPRTSRLVTWEDARAGGAFLDALNAAHSSPRVAPGYGASSLAWLAAFEPRALEGYDCAGTIGDLVVAVLCGLDAPVMDPTNAAAFGLYDAAAARWDRDAARCVHGARTDIRECIFVFCITRA